MSPSRVSRFLPCAAFGLIVACQQPIEQQLDELAKIRNAHGPGFRMVFSRDIDKEVPGPILLKSGKREPSLFVRLLRSPSEPREFLLIVSQRNAYGIGRVLVEAHPLIERPLRTLPRADERSIKERLREHAHYIEAPLATLNGPGLQGPGGVGSPRDRIVSVKDYYRVATLWRRFTVPPEAARGVLDLCVRYYGLHELPKSRFTTTQEEVHAIMSLLPGEENEVVQIVPGRCMPLLP